MNESTGAYAVTFDVPNECANGGDCGAFIIKFTQYFATEDEALRGADDYRRYRQNVKVKFLTEWPRIPRKQ